MKTLDSKIYAQMLFAGLSSLGNRRDEINRLNVFPVPDGDTGDNMYMTLDAGCRAISGLEIPLGELASVASKGMLLGARGNSGVILSRIFAGIAKGLEDLDTATVAQFVAAMDLAVQEAYAAVSKPVEGTILTVLKDSVSAASGVSGDLDNYFTALIQEMEAALGRTTSLLKTLQEAGVVDSGGAGLLCIAGGMAEGLNGKAVNPGPRLQDKAPDIDLDAFGSDSVLEYGYCTEFLLRLQSSKVDLNNFNESVIGDYLNSAGDSVVCFRDGSIIKAHVHTKTPGDILNRCQQWGEFLTLKIENMTLQHNESEAKPAEKTPERQFSSARKPLAVVSVAAGAGLADALREAGADIIIEGGQTMNPSAASFVEAFRQLDADTVLVFPNNSNIILTAQQAAGLYSKSRVEVIPTRSFGEGYVAIASMDRSVKDIDALVEGSKKVAAGVVTGLVSKATRDALIGGVAVHEGDFIGFRGGNVLSDAPGRNEAAATLCDRLGTSAHEVVLVFTGGEVSQSEAKALESTLKARYGNTEFIFNSGGQPVYDYIIVLC